MGESTADTASKPNFGPLEGNYQILGELRGSRRTRTYLARRRPDGDDVTISIYSPPSSERANELSHYAADVKQLADLHHPHLITAIEARWVGPSLAVVSERIKGETLDDLLDRQEHFSNPRIAAILNEVFAVLEWARARGVVHRGVPPDHLFFEEDTQRVMIAFAPTAIPISGVPAAGADAKTIGMLAWAMLTGKPYVASKNGPRLGALAPNLASRVIDATERLVGSDGSETETPDVRTLLGVLAAGDVLKQAEVEMAALKEEYHERHRAELAKCEQHRREVEQHAAEAASALADERAAFKEQVHSQEAALTDKRADFDRVMMERQQQLAVVRAELETQAEDLERRLEEFDVRRTQFEKAVMHYQKSAKNLETAKRTSARKGGKPGKGSQGPAAFPVMPPLSFAPDRKREKSHKATRTKMFANLDAPARPPAPAGSRKKRWILSSVAGALGVALVATVVVARQQGVDVAVGPIKLGNSTVVPTTGNVEQGKQSRGGFMSQSAGGTVPPGTVGAPYAKPGDTVAIVRPDTTPAQEETAPAPRPRPKPREPANDGEGMQAPPVRYVPPVDTTTHRESVGTPQIAPPRDTTYMRAPPPPTVPRETAPIRDNAFRRESGYRVDTTVKRDSIIIPGAWTPPEASPRRDTTAPRRDTTTPRSDTGVKRDTLARPAPIIIPPTV